MRKLPVLLLAAATLVACSDTISSSDAWDLGEDAPAPDASSDADLGRDGGTPDDDDFAGGDEVAPEIRYAMSDWYVGGYDTFTLRARLKGRWCVLIHLSDVGWSHEVPTHAVELSDTGLALGHIHATSAGCVTSEATALPTDAYEGRIDGPNADGTYPSFDLDLIVRFDADGDGDPEPITLRATGVGS